MNRALQQKLYNVISVKEILEKKINYLKLKLVSPSLFNYGLVFQEINEEI